MKAIPFVIAAGLALATPVRDAAAQCNWGSMRSVGSNDTRQLTVINAVGDRTATLSWIDFNGNKVRYAQIPPNGRHVQQTYRGHVWISENSYGYCDIIFTVENNVEIVIK